MSEFGSRVSQDEALFSAEQTEAFVRAEQSWLVRYFRGRTRNSHDAQDLAQETILLFLRTAQTNAIHAPQNLLRRIASNLVKEHAQRGATRISRGSVPLIEIANEADVLDPAKEAQSREELGHWVGVLERLKPKTRDIFLMSRLDGYSYKEIAGHYRMTVWGVKKHMTKAIAHIDRNRKDR